MARDAHRTTFSFTVDAQHVTPLPRRGTVVYLHGWGLDGGSMLAWALALADAGYDGVAVDLRNHGGSSRAPAGFGPREAGDIVSLLDGLDARGELHPPVYLFGVSYGASTALFAEPALRGRLAGIVAMEPYANAADGIHGLVAGTLAEDGGNARWRVFRAYARRRYTPAVIDGAIADAGRRLQLDLSRIDVRASLARSRTCTLLLHGGHDDLLPVATTRRLATLAPVVRYAELPDENHMTLPVRIDWLATPIGDWLQATAQGRCPEMRLPPDPLLGAQVAAGTGRR